MSFVNYSSEKEGPNARKETQNGIFDIFSISSSLTLTLVSFLTGFHGVTKLEFKRDARDIDKRSSLMNMNETDSEDEIESSVPVTMRPPCTHDSTAYKKMNRFKAWVSDPKLVSNSVARFSSCVFNSFLIVMRSLIKFILKY